MYALQQALKALRNNWVASVATVATMTLSLIILAGFSLLTLNLNAFLSSLQDELTVTAYLDKAADAGTLTVQMQNWPQVRRAFYTSSTDGLSELSDALPAVQEAAAIVGNPLPDRIDLQLTDPLLTPQVRARLEATPGVADIQDGSKAVETFLAISDAVRIIGSILIVVLLVSSMFAIVNSIRAAIQARQGEIEVMRLVGATRGFIRGPFLLEGFLLGLTSALIALVLVVPGYGYVLSRLGQALPFVPLVQDLGQLGQVALLLTALALLVGLVGSTLSVTQHLREDRV